ncbi:uncharacterized protein LOC135846261 [Planococcus citri]|uniref:uncharacterized protein LOC135846004 n=1 Tax=Planococcus citri TaxID=170843 RepID=UPI0031F882EE
MDPEIEFLSNLNIQIYNLERQESKVCGFFKESECDVDIFLQSLKRIGYVFSVRHTRNLEGKLVTVCNNKEIRIDIGHVFKKNRQFIFHCAHGEKYYKIKQDEQQKDHPAGKKQRFHVQNTKKMDCVAEMKILKITVFPDYNVSQTTHWREKKEELQRLEENLKKGAVVQEIRYYFSMSIPSAHNHSIATALLNLRIDSTLENEIQRLVDLGITNVEYVRKELRNFVKTNYPQAPSESTAFYPETQTIYNYVLKHINLKYRSTIDQDQLLQKMDEWKHDENDDIFFRPYSEDENGTVQTLLFCYQNKFQKHLLKRYGSVCCLDATYKTTKYALPLFFLVVKTNVNYVVAAVFIIQHENATCIAEALTMLKNWNPDWNVQYFMTDFCTAEINAIEQCFNCSTFICAFHREQCWDRWLKQNKNVPDKQDVVHLKTMWKKLARSLTESDFKKNFEDLKASQVWLKNEAAKKYFMDTWYPVRRKWSEAFFNADFLFKITTNNGIESQNHVLKHSYLKQYSNKSMTSVLDIIITQFLVDARQNYSKINSRLNSEWKTYNKEIPDYLVERPEFFIKHVYDRIASAKNAYTTNKLIHCVAEGKFLVKSEKKTIWYCVDFKKPSCTCDDYRRWKFPCKHLGAIFLHVPGHSFTDLPKDYLDNPFITIDPTFNIFSSLDKDVSKNAAQENDLPLENSSSENVHVEEVINLPEMDEDFENDTDIIINVNTDDQPQPTNFGILITNENSEAEMVQDPNANLPIRSSTLKKNIREAVKDLLNLTYLIKKDPDTNNLQVCYDSVVLASEALKKEIVKENGLELLPLPSPHKKKRTK